MNTLIALPHATAPQQILWHFSNSKDKKKPTTAATNLTNQMVNLCPFSGCDAVKKKMLKIISHRVKDYASRTAKLNSAYGHLGGLRRGS